MLAGKILCYLQKFRFTSFSFGLDVKSHVTKKNQTFIVEILCEKIKCCVSW